MLDVENPDGVSDFQGTRHHPTWPEQQRQDTKDGQRERRELPATDPKFLSTLQDADAHPEWVEL